MSPKLVAFFVFSSKYSRNSRLQEIPDHNQKSMYFTKKVGVPVQKEKYKYCKTSKAPPDQKRSNVEFTSWSSVTAVSDLSVAPIFLEAVS